MIYCLHCHDSMSYDVTSKDASELELRIFATTDWLAKSREQQRALQRSQRDLRTKTSAVADKAFPHQNPRSRASVGPHDPQQCQQLQNAYTEGQEGLQGESTIELRQLDSLYPDLTMASRSQRRVCK